MMSTCRWNNKRLDQCQLQMACQVSSIVLNTGVARLIASMQGCEGLKGAKNLHSHQQRNRVMYVAREYNKLYAEGPWDFGWVGGCKHEHSGMHPAFMQADEVARQASRLQDDCRRQDGLTACRSAMLISHAPR